MSDSPQPGAAPGQRPPGAPASAPTATAPASDGATRRRFRILGLVVLVAALGAGAYWYSTRHLESTDNAVIDGDIVQISPRIGGAVLALNVTDNQAVRRGDLLFTLDPRDFEIA